MQSAPTAMKWYTLAAEQGHTKAQFGLGAMHALGESVPVNYVYAYMWMSISASLGDTNASESLRSIESEMTPEQIEEAKRRAIECTEKNYKGC